MKLGELGVTHRSYDTEKETHSCVPFSLDFSVS